MNAFAFRDAAAVRQMGSALVIGTCLALMAVSALVWSIAQKRAEDIAALEDMVARAEQLSTRPTAPGPGISVYQSDTPQLAQSQMQSDMQELAEEFDLRLEVIRADQIEQLGAQVRMALTLNGVVPEAQLGGYLQGLSQHEPIVIVDSINLRRARSTTRGSDERLLSIQLKLHGFATQ